MNGSTELQPNRVAGRSAERRGDLGHDPTLFEQTLRLTPDQRIDRGVAFANFVRRNAGTARGR